MKKFIHETELFEIYFAGDRLGEKHHKFSNEEIQNILKATKKTEEIITKILEFSLTQTVGRIYKVTIIFDRYKPGSPYTKKINHHGMIIFPPIGTKWDETENSGIDIISKTAIIIICNTSSIKELEETAAHELTHALIDSFLSHDGINSSNNLYFIEGITEWITKFSSRFFENM